MLPAFFAHPTAVLDEPCQIGLGSKIWHFCHISRGAVLGQECVLGQNVFVAGEARVGNHCKIQNNVSLYAGIELEDEVFCGPSCVFTNVINPRAEFNRRDQYQRTVVKRGATLGANATLVCGITIGRYAFVAAGAVVNTDVPDYGLMMGVPAWQDGWMGRHGFRLVAAEDQRLRRPETGWLYEETAGTLRCLDWPEDRPLPPAKG